MNWIKVSDRLPPVSEKDEWNKKRQITDRVLVNAGWVARFGTYNHLTKQWNIENSQGFTILHWMEIELPKE